MVVFLLDHLLYENGWQSARRRCGGSHSMGMVSLPSAGEGIVRMGQIGSGQRSSEPKAVGDCGGAPFADKSLIGGCR